MVNSNTTIKKIIYLFLIIITLFIFDNAIAPFFAIKNIYPSVLFVFIVCYSIINGYNEGVIIGVITGALQDIYFPGVIGINMLINMLICLIAARIGKGIFKEKAIVPIFSTFILSLLKSITIFVILILIKSSNNFMHLIIYKAIYEMVIALLIYRIILKFSETKTIKKEWRF
ncbi:rod shape-determining protein MreD [Clostridium sp. UBA1056]|uniref:rod shape-determining protein MreD n=1 Tax=unclassified Clostridium TaxID=2614128 RepID=UPI003217526C